ncbi:unnamed protein product [Ilex paraguariensis]|uniref:Carotenoid cleavage dioxygenase 4 n=1 Tax=Ilex paraguariensis TaxID=185542 RepID=A0ABC8QW27_9AQUA
MDALSSTFVFPLSDTKPLPSPITTTKTSLSPQPRLPLFTVSSFIKEKSTSKNYKPSTYPSKPTSKKSTPLAPPTARPVERSLPAIIFKIFDDIINNFIDPPLRPSVDPRCVLSNNYAPVDELPPTECEVIYGFLPLCLDGAYIRNGPNPQFHPRGPSQLFDGDGMLHSIKISQGRAIFCSRYVRTYKYVVERDTGSPVIPSLFSVFIGLTASAARVAVTAARVFAGKFNFVNGIGVANTSLALFGGRLYALCEYNLPYSVKVAGDGIVVTLGRHDFDGKIFMSMTAHPKIDSDTGEAFAFRYNAMPPFLTFFRFNSDGTKQADVPIFSMARPSFLHDFAISKKYAIFSDTQIGVNPVDMIVEGGIPMRSDPEKLTRLGVIPRYAKDESEMRWFDDEDGGNTVVMVAPNILSESRLCSDQSGLCGMRVEKNRYAYAAVGVSIVAKVSGMVKLDVSVSEDDRRDCIVASRMFGPGCYGGQPFFVAKSPANPQADEDDGYVLTYAHDENTGESKFLVMAAKSPDFEIVAAVRLPNRVPYGLHLNKL